MADFERLKNAAIAGVKAEAIAQMAPHVERAKNGITEALGIAPDADDDDEEEGDDEAMFDPADLAYFFGLDGTADKDESLSLAVAVWRTVAVADGSGLSHWIAIHKQGYTCCAPADTIEDEVIAKSEAMGISSAGWTVHDKAMKILAFDFDIGDIADFADEICDDDDELDEQVRVHNGFNWEHESAAIVAMDIPGVRTGWQLGHALTLDTTAGKLDWSGRSPRPFAVGIGDDTYIIHGANIQTTPKGIKISGGHAQSYADWRLEMDRKFGENDRYELDGVDGPAYPMGRAKRFDYRSNKDQSDPAKFDEYTHQHGEETGELPMVFAIGPRTIAVSGGNMHIAPEGVRD